MSTRKRTLALLTLVGAFVLVLGLAAPAFAAYHHMGEIDSDFFLEVHPEAAGTKLDSCTLCHSGGSYVDSKGKTVSLGSCQWCHYVYGYDAMGDILVTLNPYGLDYLMSGRVPAAVRGIESTDSDLDGFSNADEIAAVRYPGDPDDDPTKVEAPYRVYSLSDIEAMDPHTQFLLMNTHKSGDSYVEYTGVPVADILNEAGVLSWASGIKVSSPDGFSQYHPLDYEPGMYPVRWIYPAAPFFYSPQADAAITTYGWCDYSAPSSAGRSNGEPIEVDGGLKLLLAYKREGAYLQPGVLNTSNKLDGEGPFRVVPPQAVPGPPDQSSTSPYQSVIWPFAASWDHNAGYATRSATIVRVEPLPAGTTDIDIMEAGWDYVDASKFVVYGAIDPIPTTRAKLAQLSDYVEALPLTSWRGKNMTVPFAAKIAVVDRLLSMGKTAAAIDKIETDLLPKVDGVATAEALNTGDWILEPTAQRRAYWALKEMLVLLAIEP
ncbi:MAG: GEGP motif-containing diheme protein [Coriobacteriia bacterium]